MSTFDATVHLSVGTGHVVRRSAALLYLPQPDDTVRAAFVAAADGEELQAVASATVAAGFSVAPFVCVAWPGAVRVMVFGDVAVETDQAQVPMFTGAGSRTWVEQTIPVDDAAQISALPTGEDADAATDLRDGTTHAGGFVLALTAGRAAEPVDPVSSVEPVEPVDIDAVAPREQAIELPAPSAGDVDTSLPAPTAAREPTAPTARPTTHEVPSAVADDPALALAAIQAAAMNEDGEPMHATDPPTARPATATDLLDVVSAAGTARAPDDHLDDGHLDDVDDDHTLPPPEPGQLWADLSRDDAGREERGALVEAKVCTAGHPNPPTVATCVICGALLSPGSAAVSHVRRPSLGSLRLDDGERIELDDELLIGRNPGRDESEERAALQRVRVEGDKVSRSHIEVRFQGWDVLVTDCGSTNGTFVVPHPGGQVIALEANRPHLVEPDAVVYFGSRSFTVVGRGR